MEKALEFCEDFPQVWDYLPDKAHIYNCPREWVFTIINSVIETEFTAWVNGLIAERDAQMRVSQDMDIAVTE